MTFFVFLNQLRNNVALLNVSMSPLSKHPCLSLIFKCKTDMLKKETPW